jgi:hypothetical protein
MRLRTRRQGPPAWAHVPGTLAWAVTDDGLRCVVGTRHTLVVVTGTTGTAEMLSWPWEGLRGAEWDRDTTTLTVRPLDDGDDEDVEAVEPVEPVEPVVLRLDDAGRLLQLVRERISASVVLQRPVRLTDGTVRIVGRRRPGGPGPISWTVDHGTLDATDPVVAAEVAAALVLARADAEA